MDGTEPIFPSTGLIADAAQRIAFQAHQGQFDKSGARYIDHPARVAARLSERGYPDAVVAAGWLHDVLEDTDWTATCLEAAGMTAETIRLVQAMTRLPGQRAEDYYAVLIAAGEHAVAVKIADIDDNTDPARVALLDPEVRARLGTKYAKARSILAQQPA